MIVNPIWQTLLSLLFVVVMVVLMPGCAVTLTPEQQEEELLFQMRNEQLYSECKRTLPRAVCFADRWEREMGERP